MDNLHYIIEAPQWPCQEGTVVVAQTFGWLVSNDAWLINYIIVIPRCVILYKVWAMRWAVVLRKESRTYYRYYFATVIQELFSSEQSNRRLVYVSGRTNRTKTWWQLNTNKNFSTFIVLPCILLQFTFISPTHALMSHTISMLIH